MEGNRVVHRVVSRHRSGVTSRWYQSRSFRIGLVGLLLLLGACGFFQRRIIAGSYGTPGGLYLAAWGGGVAQVGYLQRDHPALSVGHYTGFKAEFLPRTHAAPVPVFFHPAFSHENEAGVRIFIAFRVILLAYSALWLGTLWWWQRRKHRLMTAHGIGAGESV